MAAVYLSTAFGPTASEADLDIVRRTAGRWGPILKMASTGINAPLTSSAGRLFDAAAALAGMRDTVTYEGQAAIELEQAADPTVDDAYPCPVRDGLIDGVELMAHLAADLANRRPVPEAAAAFHNGLAKGLVEAAMAAAAEEGLTTVALSGGTFQNQLLASCVMRDLEAAGLEVLIHNRVPANDGGISLGQAAIANATLNGV